MIKYDVSVMFAVEQEYQMNVVHCLVRVVVYDPGLELVMVETYLHICGLLPIGGARRLLEMENSAELRPLEFAMQQVNY